MGNYASCTLTTSLGSQTKAPKVIFPSGEIRQLNGPANAAELMLEAPGNFLVNSRCLQVGRRFSPLMADEDLELGNVYVMLPMARVNSVVMAADVGRLFIAADKAVRRMSGGRARILPDTLQTLPEPDATPRLKLDDAEGSEVEFKYRTNMCRSRRPVLETIVEEVCSR